MQEKIQIISDGSLDLSRELTRERDILVVPFYVSFDGETYLKEGVELDIREFYQRMVDHPDVFPKTSMPSVDDYYQVFLPLAKQDVPMICICITTKFSGSMQSATTARDMILEEYPKARITVIDAEINTVLQGLYVLEACRLRDLGWEYDRMVKRLLAIRESGRIFFTIGNIDYLKHGGRIGKVMGIAGSVGQTEAGDKANQKCKSYMLCKRYTCMYDFLIHRRILQTGFFFWKINVSFF